jgi:transposase
MGRKVKELKNYTIDQIESLLRSDSNYLIGVKLHAVIQLGRGYSSRKLSEFYRTSFKQLNNWFNRFDVEGIEGLRIKPGRGRHSFLTEEQKNQLRDDINKTPQEFGYNSTKWTGPIIRKHINRVYHVTYRQAAVYNLMRQLGLKK